MKHSLPQRPLRFATTQAYDAPLRGAGTFWVERSAEHFSLDEPLGASHADEDAAAASPADVESAEQPFIRGKNAAVCTNPFRDDPSPSAIGTVKRFGVVGLVKVAVSAGIARWWNSVGSRNH